ncbi:MAG TPA: chemotaxis protein CheB [Dongiaceae bacterium]|nr:chemotaxis protein CheB [Dongiaceae bacterium]
MSSSVHMTHVQPIGAPEHRSRKTPDRCGIALLASAGGIAATIKVLSVLPPDLQAPIFLSQHLPHDSASELVPILQRRVQLKVSWAASGQAALAGNVYVVPPGHALEVHARRLEVRKLPRAWQNWFNSADALLQSMAATYGAGAIAVTLSGMMATGLIGLRAIRKEGGLAIAQSEESCSFFPMPQAAIDFGMADMVFPPERIAEALMLLAETVG